MIETRVSFVLVYLNASTQNLRYYTLFSYDLPFSHSIWIRRLRSHRRIEC